jgi:hypothetical protein
MNLEELSLEELLDLKDQVSAQISNKMCLKLDLNIGDVIILDDIYGLRICKLSNIETIWGEMEYNFECIKFEKTDICKVPRCYTSNELFESKYVKVDHQLWVEAEQLYAYYDPKFAELYKEWDENRHKLGDECISKFRKLMIFNKD